ncbi:MAG: cupin domain-containing protein [Chloroflexi bacterium]|nr:cupin domain-containing protein [Chloroflexota bacterium]
MVANNVRKTPDYDLATGQPAASIDSASAGEDEPAPRWVRPDVAVQNRQRLGQFVGISNATAGATMLSLSLIVVPPGGRAEPHVHQGYETAIYVLQGRVETRYGRHLAKSIVNQTGDFIFIPAGLPHQPINLSADEPAMAVIARNDANESEHVRLYDPATDTEQG